MKFASKILTYIALSFLIFNSSLHANDNDDQDLYSRYEIEKCSWDKLNNECDAVCDEGHRCNEEFTSCQKSQWDCIDCLKDGSKKMDANSTHRKKLLCDMSSIMAQVKSLSAQLEAADKSKMNNDAYLKLKYKLEPQIAHLLFNYDQKSNLVNAELSKYHALNLEWQKKEKETGEWHEKAGKAKDERDRFIEKAKQLAKQRDQSEIKLVGIKKLIDSMIPGADLPWNDDQTFFHLGMIDVKTVLQIATMLAIETADAYFAINKIPVAIIKTMTKKQVIDKIKNVLATEGKIPFFGKAHDFAKSHSLSGNASSRKVDQFANDMKKQGNWGEFPPVHIIEHNGTKYVIDGHHRIEAARRANVEVRYKLIKHEEIKDNSGFKDLNDVLISASEAVPHKLKLD